MANIGATKTEWAHFDVMMGLTTELLPVVSNPKAVISPNSKMKKVGKTPSIYNFNRQVAGLPNWTGYKTSAANIQQWMKEPDYGICSQSRKHPAIDIDVADKQLSDKIAQFVENFLQMTVPRRVRANSGKQLMAFTVDGEFPKRSVKVDGGIIEALANGQQFVLAGTNTSDGISARITWVTGGVAGLPDDFPAITKERFDELWAALVEEFGIEAPIESSGSASRKKGDDLGLADPILHKLNILDYGKGGQAYITCPFEAEHTMSSGITETTYFPRGTAGYEQGHFKCLHAHCQGRTDLEFQIALGIVDGEIEDLPTVYEQKGAHGASAVMLPWPGLLRNKAGRAVANVPNIRKIISNPEYCGIYIRYDRYRGEIMYAPFAAEMKWVPFADDDYTKLRDFLEERGFLDIGRDKIRDVVSMVARDNQFDSGIEWVESLKWDGVPRIETFLIKYFGAEDTPYVRGVALYIWSALAGRLLVPGVQADMVPILEGEQGILKSSAIAAMVPSLDCYCKISFNEDEDKITRKLRGRMLAEIDELRGINSRELESIKSFVTSRFDLLIQKFKEFSTSYHRRCLFMGTTNKQEFLADETGNRRWLPLRVLFALIDLIIRDRDQLWAEGAVYFKKNGVHWQVEKLAEAEHQKYVIHDIWEEAIHNYLYSEDIKGNKPIDAEYITTNQLLTFALNLDTRHVKNNEQWRIGKILRVMGFEKAVVREKGKTRKAWKLKEGYATAL